jgi:predicted nucleic acid-binding protein
MRTIYVETSIFSYLAGRSSRNALIAACQGATRRWWREQRHRYELFASELVHTEIAAGDPHAAKKRLVYLEGIPELQVVADVRALAKALVRPGALPPKAEADALHIAVATVHGMDFLLTWNCRHINNPVMKPKIRWMCAGAGYSCPEICTPIEILEYVSDEE